MKFFEAVEIARKTGKIIKDSNGNVAHWRVGGLYWINSTYVAVHSSQLDDDWQVIEPPPKEYDFAEAYQMMKAGKWMKSLANNLCYRIDRQFSSAVIDGKWIEVQP